MDEGEVDRKEVEDGGWIGVLGGEAVADGDDSGAGEASEFGGHGARGGGGAPTGVEAGHQLLGRIQMGW